MEYQSSMEHWLVIPDSTARLAVIRTGKLDWLTGVTWEHSILRLFLTSGQVSSIHALGLYSGLFCLVGVTTAYNVTLGRNMLVVIPRPIFVNNDCVSLSMSVAGHSLLLSLQLLLCHLVIHRGL